MICIIYDINLEVLTGQGYFVTDLVYIETRSSTAVKTFIFNLNNNLQATITLRCYNYNLLFYT